MTFDEWIRQPHVSHGGEVSSFYRQIWDAAQAVEREACAKEAEKLADIAPASAPILARVIRARRTA